MSDIVRIREATPRQLHIYLTAVLGADLPWTPDLTPERLIGELNRMGYTKETIQLPPETTGGLPSAGIRKGQRQTRSSTPETLSMEDKVTIFVERSDKEDGDRDIFASVNGRAILIPRGKPVEIARKYLHVLENAIQTVFSKAADGTLIPRDVPTYPFRVVSA